MAGSTPTGCAFCPASMGIKVRAAANCRAGKAGTEGRKHRRIAIFVTLLATSLGLHNDGPSRQTASIYGKLADMKKQNTASGKRADSLSGALPVCDLVPHRTDSGHFRVGGGALPGSTTPAGSAHPILEVYSSLLYPRDAFRPASPRFKPAETLITGHCCRDRRRTHEFVLKRLFATPTH